MDTYEAYMPVDPDFYDVIKDNRGNYIKVFYFNPGNELRDAQGTCKGILKADQGEFLFTGKERLVRLDTIITLNGRPGPAFDKYDGYANACLSCQAGYD